MDNDIIVEYIYLDSDERKLFANFNNCEYKPLKSEMIVINVQSNELQYYIVDIISDEEFITVNENTYELIL